VFSVRKNSRNVRQKSLASTLVPHRPHFRPSPDEYTSRLFGLIFFSGPGRSTFLTIPNQCDRSVDVLRPVQARPQMRPSARERRVGLTGRTLTQARDWSNAFEF
jgi:hypothetical protein